MHFFNLIAEKRRRLVVASRFAAYIPVGRTVFWKPIRRKEVAMLVLSRKLNEKIVINGDIVVTVVKIDRNQVRIGISAPDSVPIHREELLRPEAQRPPVADAVVAV